jgi:hypothetical protein
VNQQLKNNLILVGVIFALVMIGYYAFSPYQSCIRAMSDGSAGEVTKIGWCNNRTDW